MPLPPKRADHDDREYPVQVRVPGWLKNRILDAAEADQISVNNWLLHAVLTGLNHSVPPPAPLYPIPDLTDQIRAASQGERLLGPCGEPVEKCAGANEPLLGGSFCSVCGLRCH